MPTPDEATVFEQFRAACALIAAGDDRGAAAVLEDVKRRATALPLDDDLDRPLWGAKAIGAAINSNVRRAHHMLESGFLPGTKVGALWCSTKRKLLARIHGEDGWVRPEPKPAPPATPLPKSRKKRLRPRKAKG